MAIQRGDFVRTWFDTGAGKMGGMQILYGRCTAAGAKAFYVVWESGHTNRVRRASPGDVQFCATADVDPAAVRRLSEYVDPRLEDMDDAGLSAALEGARCSKCGTTKGTFVSLTRCWPCDREVTT